MDFNFSTDKCHELWFSRRKPELSFDENKDYGTWKKQVEAKLKELLGEMPEKVDPNFQILWEKKHDTFTETRFVFTTEELCDVPCNLWVPNNAKKPCPVVICLQGHSTGAHISMGQVKYPGDEEVAFSGDRDFAVQIIKEGYAALIMDSRGFGERKSERMLNFFPDADCTCDHPAMVALLMGRTIIGERTWDVSRAIDVLDNFKDVIDTKKIGLMGNSGGGTATYYTACVEPRISVAMPSCSVCTYHHSIITHRHCPCNYIPQSAKYFDMGDLSCLIAPRPLVLVAGQKDHGFIIDGVNESFETIKKVYEKAGAPENCKLVVGSEGHRFYKEPSWDVFREVAKW